MPAPLTQETCIVMTALELIDSWTAARRRGHKTRAVNEPTRSMMGFSEFFEPGNHFKIETVTYLIGVSNLRESIDDLKIKAFKTFFETPGGRNLLFSGESAFSSFYREAAEHYLDYVPTNSTLIDPGPLASAQAMSLDWGNIGLDFDFGPDPMPNPPPEVAAKSKRLAKKGHE